MSLSNDLGVIKLARDLHLPQGGDPLSVIREFAIGRVHRTIAACPVPVDDLDTLRAVVADKFRVCLEFLYRDQDIARVATEHAEFHPFLSHRLQEEFVEGDTEGITLERHEWDPVRYRYLAVVDARGQRVSRAFFTAWHEITHLIIHPEQLPFPGFRRSPSPQEAAKDPIESVVDHVAARIGFYPPLFAPILDKATRNEGGFTFRALDQARSAADPGPSLHATALASINFASEPMMFLSADLACKKAEARALRSRQQTFEFAVVEPKFDLRAVTVAANDAAKRSQLVIHPNIRVPRESVVFIAFENSGDVELCGHEDQAWWENSKRGRLPALPLRVQAVRRGRFVYGLLQAGT